MEAIKLRELPGATEFTLDSLTRYAHERGGSALVAPFLGTQAAQAAQRYVEGLSSNPQSSEGIDPMSPAALGTVLINLLDAETRRQDVTDTRSQRNFRLPPAPVPEQPQLITLLREHANLPTEDRPLLSWRLAASRSSRQPLIFLHYSAQLPGKNYVDKIVDVGLVGDQIYAGNGELVYNNLEADIARVAGVGPAIMQDITALQATIKQ
jgi:hypothetical protein